MDGGAAASGALGDMVVFLNYFNKMPDRRLAGKVVYPLDEVLLLALLAGADGFTDIARFGGMKLDLLQRFAVSTVGRVLTLTASLLTAAPQRV
jgi:hypothetical protein